MDENFCASQVPWLDNWEAQVNTQEASSWTKYRDINLTHRVSGCRPLRMSSSFPHNRLSIIPSTTCLHILQDRNTSINGSGRNQDHVLRGWFALAIFVTTSLVSQLDALYECLPMCVACSVRVHAPVRCQARSVHDSSSVRADIYSELRHLLHLHGRLCALGNCMLLAWRGQYQNKTMTNIASAW